MRASLADANDRIREQDSKASAALDELRLQLVAAVARADAADRRVARELERERTARARADRNVEALQKSVDAIRDRSAAADAQARRQLNAAHEREAELKGPTSD